MLSAAVEPPNIGNMRHKKKELHESILARLELSCPKAQAGARWVVVLFRAHG